MGRSLTLLKQNPHLINVVHGLVEVDDDRAGEWLIHSDKAVCVDSAKEQLGLCHCVTSEQQGRLLFEVPPEYGDQVACLSKVRDCRLERHTEGSSDTAFPLTQRSHKLF